MISAERETQTYLSYADLGRDVVTTHGEVGGVALRRFGDSLGFVMHTADGSTIPSVDLIGPEGPTRISSRVGGWRLGKYVLAGAGIFLPEEHLSGWRTGIAHDVAPWHRFVRFHWFSTDGELADWISGRVAGSAVRYSVVASIVPWQLRDLQVPGARTFVNTDHSLDWWTPTCTSVREDPGRSVIVSNAPRSLPPHLNLRIVFEDSETCAVYFPRVCAPSYILAVLRYLGTSTESAVECCVLTSAKDNGLLFDERRDLAKATGPDEIRSRLIRACEHWEYPLYRGEPQWLGGILKAGDAPPARPAAPTDATVEPGSSPSRDLLAAACEGRLDGAREALAAGALIDHVGHDGLTALGEAARRAALDVLGALLEWGADPDLGKHPPLHIAAAEGHTGVLQRLLEHPSTDPNVRNWKNFTALHTAAEFGRAEAAAVLLKHGARVRSMGESNITPLHLAAQNGHPRVVELLLSAGARIDDVSTRGERPLDSAQRNGHHQVIGALRRAASRAPVSPTPEPVRATVQQAAEPEVLTADFDSECIRYVFEQRCACGRFWTMTDHERRHDRDVIKCECPECEIRRAFHFRPKRIHRSLKELVAENHEYVRT